MKLLVTGGAGFIGSAVVRRAITEGFAVVNVDALTSAGSFDNLAAVEDDRRYAFEYADVCDAEAMAMIFARHSPDMVLHLAAESHAALSARTNMIGTAVLLEAARAYADDLPDMRRDRFRFHHVSTDEVFGALGDEGAFDEASPHRPNSPYAASKAGADMLVRAWGKTYGLPVLISHTSNNYGPYQHPDNLIPTAILNGLAGRPIPVYGRGLHLRDWLYVDDHAAALLEVLTRGKPGETYCIGGEAERTNLDLVGLVCAALDKIHPRTWAHAELVKFAPDRPGNDHRHALSNAKIRKTLGWRPRIDLEAGVARTVRWYLDHEEWVRARAFRGQRLGGLKQAVG